MLTNIEFTWDNPEGLAKDSRGWLYVADTGAGTVVRVSPSEEVETVTSAYALPVVLTATGAGDLLFNTASAGSAELVLIGFDQR